MLLTRAVQRLRPPGHREGEQPDRRGRGERRHAELGGQPPGAGDRLGPGQPVGAGLELAGDQRCAPEHTDDRRGHGDDDDPGVEEVAVVRGEVVEDVAVGRGEVGEPWAGGGQDQREGDRDGRDGRGLGPELPPGEPDHRRTSITGPGAHGSGAFHVGEHEVLEAEAAHRPGRVEDGRVGAYDEGALPVGVARRDDVLVGRQRGRVPARPGEPQVACRAAPRRRPRPGPRESTSTTTWSQTRSRSETTWRGQEDAEPRARRRPP